MLYFTKEQWFEMYGSTWLRASLSLFVLLPISFVGFIFNMISFKILNRKKFKIPLYSYLRFYSLNSGLINFMTIFFFITTSHKFFDVFDNSWIPSVYLCYVYNPLMNICLYLGSALDICLTIERNSILSPKFRRFQNYKPINVLLVLLFGSLLVTVQFYFIQYPAFVDLKLNSTRSFRLYTLVFTEFSKSTLGVYLNGAVFALRDIFLFLLQIALSFFTIILLRKHLKSKLNLMVGIQESYNPSRIINIEEINDLDKIRKIYINKIENKISISDKNLTVLVTLMVFLTSLEHVFSMGTYFAMIVFKSSFALYIALTGGVLVSVKHFSNLILFYNFNRLFKNEFKQFFRVKTRKVSFYNKPEILM